MDKQSKSNLISGLLNFGTIIMILYMIRMNADDIEECRRKAKKNNEKTKRKIKDLELRIRNLEYQVLENNAVYTGEQDLSDQNE